MNKIKHTIRHTQVRHMQRLHACAEHLRATPLPQLAELLKTNPLLRQEVQRRVSKAAKKAERQLNRNFNVMKVDPIALYERLQELRPGAEQHAGRFLLLHELYDWADKHGLLDDVPEYRKHESMQTEQTEEYQRELRERAAAGDRYAKSYLEMGSAYVEPSDE